MEPEIIAPTRSLPPYKQKCGNCQCFHVVSQQRGFASMCRFNPPVPVPVNIQNPGHMVDARQPQLLQGFQGIFPPTDRDSWCGKWQMKVEGES